MEEIFPVYDKSYLSIPTIINSNVLKKIMIIVCHNEKSRFLVLGISLVCSAY